MPGKLCRLLLAGTAAGAFTALNAPNPAAAQAPWLVAATPADQRANLLASALTAAEASQFLNALAATPTNVPNGAAGVVPAISSLGIPAIIESDATLGIRDATPHTALPSALATAATWNPNLERAGGAMVGLEGHLDQVSQLFGPGGDLVRDPRGGRTFEYPGEDPLLGGTMLAAYIRGLQSQGVIATLKHFAFNDQETARTGYNAIIGEQAARESDLLEFELAVEGGRPGAVMCAYNQVNGAPSCSSQHLLTDILKTDWAFKGFVLTDYGASQTVLSANAGLDQQSAVGAGPDYFGPALQQAVADGTVSVARTTDMLHRVLRTYFNAGVIDNPPVAGAFNAAADAAVAQSAEEEGIVLLRNGTPGQPAPLPLSKSTPAILVIGSHADVGVLAGGGSSQVNPVGGNAVPNNAYEWDPSSPLAAIKAEAPNATIAYDSGANPVTAAAKAARASVAIVFVNQHAQPGADLPGLALPPDHDTGTNQDQLVAAVAAANPNTIVVAETASAFTMPWLDQVAGVLEAWFPGAAGGPAIARTLFGDVDPSGHLPITFPQSVAQLPRPTIPTTIVDDTIEGQNVGYKWFDEQAEAPLFPFGYGLSYTSFAYAALTPQLAFSLGGLAVGAPLTLAAPLTVTNTGATSGKAVPQLYVGVPSGLGEAPKRLAGFAKLSLLPGQQQRVTITIDPRLLAEYEASGDDWHLVGGQYWLYAGDSEAAATLTASVQLPDLHFSAKHLF